MWQPKNDSWPSRDLCNGGLKQSRCLTSLGASQKQKRHIFSSRAPRSSSSSTGRIGWLSKNLPERLYAMLSRFHIYFRAEPDYKIILLLLGLKVRKSTSLSWITHLNKYNWWFYRIISTYIQATQNQMTQPILSSPLSQLSNKSSVVSSIHIPYAQCTWDLYV